MKKDRGHMESLGMLHSIFVEQLLVRSLCCQLCLDVRMECAMEQKVKVNVLHCRDCQVKC
jgi:hypothetical protein